MNIDDLAADLPNGLHDALLRSFSSDPRERRAEFILDVWLGDLHGETMSERELRRAARVDLLGLVYLVIDDPDPRYPSRDRLPVQIDAYGADEDRERTRQVPEGGFAGRFFVNEWNAFIHFAALDARLTWIDAN